MKKKKGNNEMRLRFYFCCLNINETDIYRIPITTQFYITDIPNRFT